jgi:hypothetical protein
MLHSTDNHPTNHTQMATEDVTQTKVESCRMEDEQIAHLAGYFDGVGSVTIRVIKDSDYRLGYTLQPSLRLQRSNDEDPAIGKLLAYCDEEAVRHSVSESSHGADRASSSIEWSVREPESVERFLRPMMPFLVTNYVPAEIMLTDVLPAIENDAHREKESFYHLIGVAEQLREYTGENQAAKYTQEYFEDEWSIVE